MAIQQQQASAVPLLRAKSRINHHTQHSLVYHLLATHFSVDIIGGYGHFSPLLGAVDRFAQFFHKPLFNQDCTDREVHFGFLKKYIFSFPPLEIRDGSAMQTIWGLVLFWHLKAAIPPACHVSSFLSPSPPCSPQVNAVNSENEKNLNHDGWRLRQLDKHTR